MYSTVLERLRQLSFAGVAVTAEVLRDGKLGSVGGILPKLVAAAREQTLPRIGVVVVARAQREQIEASLSASDRIALQIIYADDVAEAVELLHQRQQTRYGQVPDFTTEYQRHGPFFGRAALLAEAAEYLRDTGGRYLLLTGPPGVGKSAFALQLSRTTPTPAVVHFIRQAMGDWDEPAAILRSLIAQVRRIHNPLLDPRDEQLLLSNNPIELPVLQRLFRAVMDAAQRNMTNEQRQLIILDGLDEAFGPSGRFHRVVLPGLLPDRLPAGFAMLLTSRPGKHLEWLANPLACRPLELRPNEESNREAIRAFVRQTGIDGGGAALV